MLASLDNAGRGFGVEVNAGYGPDQIKFYIGSMIRLKGLNF
jgi:hypothetical protein